MIVFIVLLLAAAAIAAALALLRLRRERDRLIATLQLLSASTRTTQASAQQAKRLRDSEPRLERAIDLLENLVGVQPPGVIAFGRAFLGYVVNAMVG